MESVEAICITIDQSNPERGAITMQNIRSLGFKNAEYFQGVDLRDTPDSVVKDLLTPRGYYELKNGREVYEALSSRGSVGCYLAHVNAWKRCLRDNRELAVFESDFRVDPSKAGEISKAYTSAKAMGYDLFQFGYITSVDNQFFTVNGTVANGRTPVPEIMTGRNILGLAGYFISPRGAAKLLSKVGVSETGGGVGGNIDCQIDHYINFYQDYDTTFKRYVTPKTYFDDTQLPSEIAHGGVEGFGFERTVVKRYPGLLFVSAGVMMIVLICLILYIVYKR